MTAKTCFFTVVSNNYRHFARALVDSVRRHSPGAEAFVAICDGPGASDEHDRYEEIPLRALDLPQRDRFTFQYTILELNTAIKPWVIETLFRRGYERVVYFDPDIQLYGPIERILSRLDDADIVLTPHLTGHLDDGRHPSELAILQSGTYNLGFIALRDSPATRDFVAWWQGKLMRDCVVDIPRGLFTDQKWIDLVPGMYGNVRIERDPGWNVAYWNLNHRRIVEHGGAFEVDGEPLLFFHFSGFVAGERLFSRHQDRYTRDNLPAAVRALSDRYAEDLRAAGEARARLVQYAFDRFPDGTRIPPLARRCYREEFSWDAPHPDLWTPEGQRFLMAWLNEPMRRDAPWLTRLSNLLYRLRPDVQAAFPDVEGAHGRPYARWFVENAPLQEALDEPFIAPVRAALATTPDRPMHDPAQPQARASAILRRSYQYAYRAAWGVRHVVKPLTTQAFRHRIRHQLLRRAYFDAGYRIPAFVPAGGSASLPNAAAADRQPAVSTRLAEKAAAAANGINVIGYLAAESGVGELARSTLRILAAARVPVTPIDFRLGNVSRMDEDVPHVETQASLSDVNLFHINGDQMAYAHGQLGASLFEGRYNIGCWAWELPEFPEGCEAALDLLDEVWVPSAFCQQAIARRSACPVLRMPPCIVAPPPVADRPGFGVQADEVAFLAMCDVLSVPERKNPVGAAEAFRRAFPGGERARLILKLSNLEHQPDLAERLGRLARRDSRITLLPGYLSRDRVWSLLASVDAFVSLHRAEGFGFGLAEAMAYGRVAIATGWSGNVDFMRPGNALLVDYHLVPLGRDYGPYRRGQTWAEPDLDDAAKSMRQAFESSKLRERLGERARETISCELSPASLAPLFASRLALISDWLRHRSRVGSIEGTGDG